MKWILILLGLLMVGGVLVACKRSAPETPNQTLAPFVDVERFMGTWYVHGYTPTFLDPEAHDATESYELNEKGKIETTYRFRKGGPDGKWKTYRPRGWVHDEKTGAEWRMRFFGLFTAPYYILYVSDDYTETVIGHPDMELAWIMTRSARIGEADYERLKQELVEREYDLSAFRRVPQSER